MVQFKQVCLTKIFFFTKNYNYDFLNKKMIQYYHFPLIKS